MNFKTIFYDSVMHYTEMTNYIESPKLIIPKVKYRKKYDRKRFWEFFKLR